MNKQKSYNQCKKKITCSSCESNELCAVWVEFVLLHSDKKGYAHFDKRVTLAMPTIRDYVMNPEKVAKHSFYPFIHFTKTISRYGRKEPKKRQLYYCSHLDRCVYQRYAFLINQHYNKLVKELGIDNVAIAYRDNLGKNSINFAQDAFNAIRSNEKSVVIVGDFTEFFDRLDHKYLKERIACLLEGKDSLDRAELSPDHYAIFKNITRFASWDWKQLVEQSGHSITERGVRRKINNQDVLLSKEQFAQYKKSIVKNKKLYGIPQGSPISAVYSNVYMLEFDKIANSYINQNDGIYMRYSDDFLIVFPYTSDEDIKRYENFIFELVKSTPGLDLQKEKTAIYIYGDERIFLYPSNEISSIDYLGFIFDGQNIKLRPKAISKYYYRMRRKARTIGKNNWQSPQGKHITAKNLYDIYSSGGKKQTFIDYAKRAHKELNLNDRETEVLIKYHKHKIAQAIKSGAEKA